MYIPLPALLIPVTFVAGLSLCPAQEPGPEDIHTRNWVIVQENDAGHRLRMEDRDGELHVTLDGKEVPEDRILRRDGTFVILGEDGQEVLSWPQPSPPHKHIGVILGEVDEALAAWTGVDPGRCSLITSVLPDSPAAEAGLQRWDIVTGIEGQDRATPGDLKAAVAACPDGGSIRLEILRRGERLSVVVRPGEVKEEEETPRLPWGDVLHWGRGEELHEHLERALRSLREAEARILQEGGLRELREDLEEILRKSREELEKELQRLREGSLDRLLEPGRPGYRLFRDRGRPEYFLLPPEPPPLPPPGEDRPQALEERLDDISRRLDRIETLLRAGS